METASESPKTKVKPLKKCIPRLIRCEMQGVKVKAAAGQAGGNQNRPPVLMNR